MPRIRCEAVDTANFGYGPTEYHECTRPAEYRARIDMRQFGLGFERSQICAYHARQPDAQHDKFYRFRKVH